MKLMGLMFGVDVEVDVEANVGVHTSGGGWRRYLLDRSPAPATFTSPLKPATSETTQNFGAFLLAAPVGITVTGKVKSSASANLMLKFENIPSPD